MSYTYAGQYGPEALLSSAGALLPSASVTVYLSDGVTPATLYTSRTKSATTTNPVTTTLQGDLTFFADPGNYVASVAGGGSLSVQVPLDPAELGDALPFFDVRDYGAFGNGSHDDTTGIQAAITAAAAATYGGVVVIPPGDFRVSSALVISSNNVAVQGAGSSLTNIVTTSATADVFQAGTGSAIYGIHISGLTISTTVVTRTAGAGIKVNNANRAHFIDINMTKMFYGYQLVAGANIWIDRGHWYDFMGTTGIGLDVQGGNDQYVSNITAPNSGTQPAAGIRVEKSGGSLCVSNCDFVRWTYGLLIDPTSNTVNWLWFNSVAFDTCGNDGIHIAPGASGIVRGVYFHNCWTATSQASDGVIIDKGSGTVDDVHFVGHRSFNNNHHGFSLISGTNLSITSSAISGNSQAAAGSYQGIYISTPTHVVINGNHIRPMNGYANNQANGIFLDSAASDYCLITANDCTGNDLANITNFSTGTHNSVTGNLV